MQRTRQVMEQLIDRASQDRKLFSFIKDEAVKRGFLEDYDGSNSQMAAYQSVKLAGAPPSLKDPQRQFLNRHYSSIVGIQA